MKTVEAELNTMRDDDLLKTLRDVLDNPQYQENLDFSPMMRDIAKKCKPPVSPKQRSAVQAHLRYQHRLWF